MRCRAIKCDTVVQIPKLKTENTNRFAISHKRKVPDITIVATWRTGLNDTCAAVIPHYAKLL